MSRIAAPLLVFAAGALAQPAITVDRASYPDRLRAMWLGECLADWTGITTEGLRIQAPFLTDADWGTTPPDPNAHHIDFVFQDPWEADDNTDIEYLYLDAMNRLGRPLLTADEIRQEWLDHIDPNYIWVSNLRAYQLMQRGVRPPVTGMGQDNLFWAMIDAQLTTEFFGAFTPGMPEEGLRYADLPIRTTAGGFAIHAAQAYVIMHSLAPMVDPALSGRDKALWLVRQTRRWIPDTSKAADILDFVCADFEANPDPNNWELTRDRVYDRYQANGAQHGFFYRGWVESPINFAASIVALLYGQCDYRRTVQIAVLAGWDSDDPAATLGGILGLMLGHDALAAQFPGVTLSDRYQISRTRINMPDYLPDDPQAEDTFTLMAARMMPLVDQCVTAAGGTIEPGGANWRLPAPPVCTPLEANPGRRAERQSANCAVRAAGGSVTVPSPAPSSPTNPPWTYGSSIPATIADGSTADFSGAEPTDGPYFFSTQGSGQSPGDNVTLEVDYDRPVQVAIVRFIEGDQFGAPGAPSSPNGGWFEAVTVQVLVDGIWTVPQTTQSEPLDPTRPFQVIDFTLASPVQATAIRLSGPCGGTDGFITCSQLDAMAAPLPLIRLCYANCDSSSTAPILNVADFTCFLQRYAAGDPYANCDGSTTDPVLNLVDFTCFLQKFAAGCP
jgi:hypothetical protein